MWNQQNILSGGGGGSSLTIEQGGISIVAGASTLNFASGATVTSAGGGQADVVVSGSGSVPTILVSCTTSEAVNDAVYVTGTDAVARANAASIVTLPAIGLILSKPTTTSAIVQLSGVFAGFMGLTPGATYFLSATTPGAVTTTAPSTTGTFVQRIGVAEDANTILLDVDPTLVEN